MASNAQGPRHRFLPHTGPTVEYALSYRVDNASKEFQGTPIDCVFGVPFSYHTLPGAPFLYLYAGFLAELGKWQKEKIPLPGTRPHPDPFLYRHKLGIVACYPSALESQSGALAFEEMDSLLGWCCVSAPCSLVLAHACVSSCRRLSRGFSSVAVQPVSSTSSCDCD